MKEEVTMYALMNGVNQRMLRTFVPNRQTNDKENNEEGVPENEVAPSTFETYEEAADAAATLAQRRATQRGIGTEHRPGIYIAICELTIVGMASATMTVEVKPTTL